MTEPKGYRALGKAGGERYKVTDSKLRARLRKRGVDVRFDNTISKRAYRNEQLRKEGWKGGLSERERTTQPWAFNRADRSAVEKAKFEQRRDAFRSYARERRISEAQAARHDSELEREFEAARSENFDKTWGRAFHRYLTLQGKNLVELDDGTFGS